MLRHQNWKADTAFWTGPKTNSVEKINLLRKGPELTPLACRIWYTDNLSSWPQCCSHELLSWVLRGTDTPILSSTDLPYAPTIIKSGPVALIVLSGIYSIINRLSTMPNRQRKYRKADHWLWHSIRYAAWLSTFYPRIRCHFYRAQ